MPNRRGARLVAAAALAASIAQTQPAHANYLLSLFYAGPGLGILSQGPIAPFVLQGFGPATLASAMRRPQNSKCGQC